jgi:hypothetical protein
MSFFRHPEIYQSDLFESARGRQRRPGLIVSMSFQLAIPLPIALQQGPLPLRQP